MAKRRSPLWWRKRRITVSQENWVQNCSVLEAGRPLLLDSVKPLCGVLLGQLWALLCLHFCVTNQGFKDCQRIRTGTRVRCWVVFLTDIMLVFCVCLSQLLSFLPILAMCCPRYVRKKIKFSECRSSFFSTQRNLDQGEPSLIPLGIPGQKILLLCQKTHLFCFKQETFLVLHLRTTARNMITPL